MKTELVWIKDLFDIEWCHFTLPSKIKNLPPGETPYWTGTKRNQGSGFKKFVNLENTNLPTEPANVFVVAARCEGSQFIDRPFLAGSKIIKFVPKFDLTPKLIRFWKERFFANFKYERYAYEVESKFFNDYYFKIPMNNQKKIFWNQLLKKKNFYTILYSLAHKRLLNEKSNYIWWDPDKRELFFRKYGVDPDKCPLNFQVSNGKKFEIYDVFSVVTKFKDPNLNHLVWSGMVDIRKEKLKYNLNDFPFDKMILNQNDRKNKKWLFNSFSCNCEFNNFLNPKCKCSDSFKIVEIAIKGKSKKYKNINQKDFNYYIFVKIADPEYYEYKIGIRFFEDIDNYLGRTYCNYEYLESLKLSGPYYHSHYLLNVSSHYWVHLREKSQIFKIDWKKIMKEKLINLK